MQSDAAGIATLAPTIMREDISHQVGAQLMALPFHTIELMKRLRQEILVQAIYRHVPVFHASRCQGKGILTSTKPRKAKME